MAKPPISPGDLPRKLADDHRHGLVDPELSLTSRGKRGLAGARPPAAAPEPAAQRSYCVVIADTARARVLTLDGSRGARELEEIAEITNPALRVRRVDISSSAYRHEVERHFAAQIAGEAAAVWSCFASCDVILAASPAMLALLRLEVMNRIGPDAQVEIRELARDLTRLARPHLHDRLSEAGLVPEREHLDTGPLPTVRSA